MRDCKTLSGLEFYDLNQYQWGGNKNVMNKRGGMYWEPHFKSASLLDIGRTTKWRIKTIDSGRKFSNIEEQQ